MIAELRHLNRPSTFLAAIAAALLCACASSHRPAAAEVPLVAGTPVSRVHTIRSAMRIRATHGEDMQSFRAQLLVEPAASRMELEAYTPLGTSAVTLFAEGDQVVFLNHLNHTAWQGSASDLAESLPFLGTTQPVQWGLAAIGYPSRLEGVEVSYGGAPVAASVPAPAVTFSRGESKIEITNLEVFSGSVAIERPAIPANYRCCVPPRI